VKDLTRLKAAFGWPFFIHLLLIYCLTATGHLGVWIDLGNNAPGLKLQRRERGQDWENHLVNRRVVKSPVDIETLPAGKYRLV